MNQHMARVGVLLKVAAGAMIGALGAVGLVAVTNRIVHPRIVDATVLVVTVLCVVAVAMLTNEAAPESHPGGPTAGPQPSSGRNAAAYQPSYRPNPAACPPPSYGPNPTAYRPLSNDIAAAYSPGGSAVAAPWHEAAARGIAGRADSADGQTRPPASEQTAKTGSGQPKPLPPVEIRLGKPGKGSADVRQIVQCPQCAGFQLGTEPIDKGFSFECRACSYSWYWLPRDPWPVTVVRPGVANPTTTDSEPRRSVWRAKS